MQARDFRSIGRAAQEEPRRRALVLIEQQGLSQGQAAQTAGVHRQTVNTWLKRYREQWQAFVRGLEARMQSNAGEAETMLSELAGRPGVLGTLCNKPRAKRPSP